MDSIRSDHLTLKLLRSILLYIIIFSMALGITFPVMSHEVGRKLERKTDISEQNDYCYLDDDYLSSILNDNPLIALSDIPKTKEVKSRDYGISAIRELEINLNAGWNLISIPLIPENSNIQAVLSSINNKYDSVWSYQEGKWKYYIAGVAGGALTTIEPGKGYWIKMKMAGKLTIRGNDSVSNTISLNKGWNLVGYNSLSPRTITEALTSIEGLYYSVWAYKDDGWLRYIESYGGNNLTEMVPYYGYWINAKDNCIWDLGAVGVGDIIRPVVDVTFDPSTPPNIGQTVTITVSATDNVGIDTKTLKINGVNRPLDASGRTTFTSSTPGVFTVTGTATDLAGNEGQVSKELIFLASGDTQLPTAQISSPADNSKITEPVNIIGTASDANLIRYKLEYSIKDRNEFITFHSGTSSVTNGILGRLDPTLLRNGLYDIKLTVEDKSGNRASVMVTYQLSGELKVGNFTMSFRDLSIPVAGLPIIITRTYDSRNKVKGDFGVCWNLEIGNLELSESGVIGKDWVLQQIGLKKYLNQSKPHYITVTYPDGKIDEFSVSASPNNWNIWDSPDIDISFPAKAGTYSKLKCLDVDPNDLIVFPPDDGDVELVLWNLDTFDPNRYELTTAEGNVYVINQQTGLESIKDSNGNTVTFSANGVIHSAGKGVTFTRDAQNRITTITDPMGRTIKYAYDYYGDLISVTDQMGNVTRFTYNSTHGIIDIYSPNGVKATRNEYDDNGRLIRSIDADGNKIEYEHNIGSRQEVVKDRLGRLTVYEYNADGYVERITDHLGNVQSFTYDSKGNKLSETDKNGKTTYYTYDARGNMLSKTDPSGNKTEYTYNDRNQILTIKDPEGNITTYTYDSKGNLLSKTDPKGNTISATYDAKGNVLTETDPDGNVTSYSYDAYGNLISKIDPLNNITNYTYDANGNRLSSSMTRTTPSGTETLVTNYVYDKLNRVKEIIDPYGNSKKVEYNSSGKISAEIDKLGNQKTYQYDSRGYLQKVTEPDGNSVEFEYDKNGRKISQSDQAGNKIEYTYDNLDKLIKITYPDGAIVSYTYDKLGRMLTETDPRGNTTTYTYDDAGNVTSITDANGNTISFAYDKNGNMIEKTDANGRKTSYEYDSAGNQTKVIFADGTNIRYTYDAMGRMTSQIDQAGNTTSYEYDELGRLTSVTDAMGKVTRYAYDEFGQKISQTDARNRITRWEYDKVGNIIKRTLPMGQYETFEYDAQGNMISRTDFNGNKTTFTYVNNVLTSKRYPDGSTVSYTYTLTGKISTISDSRGTISFTYDSRDRLKQVTDYEGRIVSYNYDLAGNITSITTSSGTTQYTYDKLNRIQKVTDPGGKETSYTYDKVGNITSITYPNGTKVNYGYDTLNRLVSVENRKQDNSLISSYAYTLGPTGIRTKVTENNGRQVTYTYDKLYRLTKEEITDPVAGNNTITYTYDDVSNRLTKTDNFGNINYTYDNNDRLTKEGNVDYTYDNNGNMLTRKVGATTINYAYDYENRLVSVQGPAINIQHVYDSNGNRISTTANGVTTKYINDINTVFTRVLEEWNSSGNLLANYIYGNSLISQYRGGTLSCYHPDGLGSTRALTNSTGVITDTYTYDAFGNIISRTGSSTNHFLFAGEQFDSEANQYYLRARYYAPGIGRFITIDPIEGNEMEPITLNKYMYGNADPVNNIDPSGKIVSLLNIVIAISIIACLAILIPASRQEFGAREKYIYLEWDGLHEYIPYPDGREIFKGKVKRRMQIDFDFLGKKAPEVVNKLPYPLTEDYKQCTFTSDEVLGGGAEGFGLYSFDGCWVFMGDRLGGMDEFLNMIKRKKGYVEFDDPRIIREFNKSATALANLGSHEVGHLFWLSHENDSGTIMDGGNKTNFNKDLNFSETSKNKLRKYYSPY